MTRPHPTPLTASAAADALRSVSRAAFRGGALALVALLACAQGDSPPESASAGGDETPAARVDGDTISVGELDAWIKDQLFERQTEGGEPSKLYELRREALDNLINDRLLEQRAAAQGTTPQALLDQEAGQRVAVSEEQVRAFYDEHAEQLGEASFEEIAPQIRNHLTQRRRPEAAREYVASLREAVEVEVLLDTPRAEVEARGPGRGPEDAAVTIVEFSDYECPFCKRAEPVVEQVLERYGDRVRFVFRHFPLDRIHPRARAAAEAAVCAEEQGRFWEYHDRLFADDAGLDPESLEQHAGEAALDLEAFRACLAQDRVRQRVEEDLVAGRQAGVSGTPAFFVNGIKLSGARPLQDFVELIDAELERAGATPPAQAEPAPAEAESAS